MTLLKQFPNVVEEKEIGGNYKKSHEAITVSDSDDWLTAALLAECFQKSQIDTDIL